MRTTSTERRWWTGTADALSNGGGDFSTAAAAGRLSATLFVLCGTLVLLTAGLAPSRTNRAGVALIGAAATTAGLIIWHLPWHRWSRSSTLWLFVPALALIATNNVLTGADGFRYDVFFLVVFAWVGLAHPQWTSVKLCPTLAVGYLAPAAFTTVNMTALLAGLAYVLPVCVLIGESAAWVSERVRRSEQGMRSSEERFRSLVQNAADGISLVDAAGVITYDSPAIETMLGYSPDERVGTLALSYVAPVDGAGLLDVLKALPAAGSARFEVKVRHRDGSWRWCDATLRNLLDTPAVASIVVNLSDVTERKNATEALAEREASFRSLFSANPHPMWVFDNWTLEFLEVNEAAVRHYGYSRAEFLSLRVPDLSDPDDHGQPSETVGGEDEDLIKGSGRHRVADGRIIDVEVTSHRLEFRGRPATLVAVRDVTDRNALDAQLRHQAFHDSLTNLANRVLFVDRVDHALARRSAAPLALLLIDLDGFKTINDSLGHTVGDELLVKVADRLRHAVRPSDTVARLGGDEFAVLIEELASDTAPALAAERILGALSTPFVVSGNDLMIGASIGIAVTAGPASTPGVLLRNADVAMYRAKADGKGTYRLFQPAMHGAALHRLELDADLRRALEEEQFELYYQPMVELRTGRVTSCEALVRWNHPRRGLIRPDRFIAAAEETGIIVPLGRWILEQACRELGSRFPVGISVNISARQLADSALAADVEAVVRETGLDPAQLTLEITESVLMRNTAASLGRLTELRQAGVRLSIDDFGTGYSALSYLRTFEVDELKIDKLFIDALPHDRQGVSLVEGIVGLASTLGLSTVAEGIESAAQQAILSSVGCDIAQGYHLARPMPLAELDQFLSLRSGSLNTVVSG